MGGRTDWFAAIANNFFVWLFVSSAHMVVLMVVLILSNGSIGATICIGSLLTGLLTYRALPVGWQFPKRTIRPKRTP